MRFLAHTEISQLVSLRGFTKHRGFLWIFLAAVWMLTQTLGWTSGVATELSMVLQNTLKLIGAGKRAKDIEGLLKKVTILRQTAVPNSERYHKIESLMRHAEAVARREPIPFNMAKEELVSISGRLKEVRQQLEALRGDSNATAQINSLTEQLDLLNEAKSIAEIRNIVARTSKNGKLVDSLLNEEQEKLEILLKHARKARRENSERYFEIWTRLNTVRDLQDMQSGFVTREMQRGADAAVTKAGQNLDLLKGEYDDLERNQASQQLIAQKGQQVATAERRLRLLQGEAQEWTAALHAPT